MCCTQAEFPASPREASLMLGPAPYCGATRVSPRLAISARHCIDDMLCGTAVDSHGVSVECEVASLSETTDVATLTLSPGSYADVVQTAAFDENSDVECISHKPMPYTRRRMHAVRETEPPCVQGVCLPNTIRLSGYVVPGESGSGCFQHGKLVAVLSVSNPGRKQAWATLVRE
jgi:hypothetical protein